MYLHQQEPALVHGDLKPDNVLVNDEGEASLCDFGMARIVQDLRTGFTTSGCGQGGKDYIAPEVMDSNGVPRKTAESDVPAFGGLILHVRLLASMASHESLTPSDHGR